MVRERKATNRLGSLLLLGKGHMKLKTIVGFATAALVVAAAAPAQTLGSVTFHGFVGQGYLNSTANNWLSTPTEEGSFAFTEAALNFTVEPASRLRIGAQFFSQDLGAIGNNRVVLDWAMGDYRFNDRIGVRAGKIKMPTGLYNIVRDNPVARPQIVMPTGIYPLSQRDFANTVQGFDAYGTADLGGGGALDYEAWVGTLDLDQGFFVGQTVEENAGAVLPALGLQQPDVLVKDLDATMRYLVGGALEWRTPLTGLRLKASLNISEGNLSYAAVYSGFQSQGPVAIPVSLTTRASTTFKQDYSVIASAEYHRGGLRLASEYNAARQVVEAMVSGLPVPTAPVTLIEEAESWYAQAAYRFNSTWELSGYYSVFYPDRNDKDGLGRLMQGQPAHRAWLKQWNFAARADINRFWLVKAEVNIFDGTATVSPLENPDGLEQDWTLFALQMVVHF